MFAPRWTVWQLTRYIRHKLTGDPELAEVWVEGEVSEAFKSAKGHLYLTLKDNLAQLKCVRWAPRAGPTAKGKKGGEGYQPRIGDQVLLRGSIVVYDWGGHHQLKIDSISPLGAGERAAALELLKKKLTAEGLFDEQYKKQLSPYPTHIGLVTSASGAAVQDLKQVLGRRWPLARITLVPTLVQGEEAGAQIAAALARADALRADLLIVGRGGGSPEDLWGFNTEVVARAIFGAKTTVISAVGHESDFTLADLVADVRAPTPSAAAELAVPELTEVSASLGGLKSRLMATIERRLQGLSQSLEECTARLTRTHPRERFAVRRELLEGLAYRLSGALARGVTLQQSRLARAAAALEALSPLAVLARGYGLVRDGQGRPRPRAAAFAPGDPLELTLADGALDCKVEKVKLKPPEPIREKPDHAPAAT